MKRMSEVNSNIKSIDPIKEDSSCYSEDMDVDEHESQRSKKPKPI